jgi:hypothetical protein
VICEQKAGPVLFGRNGELRLIGSAKVEAASSRFSYEETRLEAASTSCALARTSQHVSKRMG